MIFPLVEGKLTSWAGLFHDAQEGRSEHQCVFSGSSLGPKIRKWAGSRRGAQARYQIPKYLECLSREAYSIWHLLMLVCVFVHYMLTCILGVIKDCKNSKKFFFSFTKRKTVLDRVLGSYVWVLSVFIYFIIIIITIIIIIIIFIITFKCCFDLLSILNADVFPALFFAF